MLENVSSAIIILIYKGSVNVKATIKDIAKETGLSTATVSRVLSHKEGTYRKETADKILAAAAKLGYRRNIAAADLASNSLKTIAVILNNTQTNFWQGILDGIQEAAIAKHRQFIIFYAGNNNPKMLTEALNNALERQIAGILLVATKMNPYQMSILKRANIPYRFVSIYDANQPDRTFVSSNNVTIGRLACQYLIDQGHTQIAFAGLDRTTTGKERLLGYQQAMTKAGLPIDPAWIVNGDYSFQNGQDLFPQIQQAGVSAVVCASDMIGAGIIQAAHHAHVTIPDELSLISIDGTEVCQMVSPTLTCVKQDFFKIGASSLKSLITDDKSQFIPVKVVERESVKRIK